MTAFILCSFTYWVLQKQYMAGHHSCFKATLSTLLRENRGRPRASVQLVMLCFKLKTTQCLQVLWQLNSKRWLFLFCYQSLEEKHITCWTHAHASTTVQSEALISLLAYFPKCSKCRKVYGSFDTRCSSQQPTHDYKSIFSVCIQNWCTIFKQLLLGQHAPSEVALFGHTHLPLAWRDARAFAGSLEASHRQTRWLAINLSEAC